MRHSVRGGAAAVLVAALLVPLLGATDGPTPPVTPVPPAGAASAVVRVVAASAGDPSSAAAVLVAGMTLRQKAASVVMGHIPTTDAGDLHAYMQRTGIGGFILMGANIPASESRLRTITAALTIDAALPPLVAVDEEGGDVTRLPWDDLPSALTLKGAPASAASDAFAARAALVQRSGIGVNFGVVADVTGSRSAFIYRRALGTTPASAATLVAAAVEGEGDEVLSTLKHFPGHGAASGDSHTTIPSTGLSLGDWRATDAKPFQAGIAAGAPVLMFGHLRYRAVDDAPASLSAKWHAIARDDLGFDGVAITDDLGMLQASGIRAYRDPVANAVAALRAGSDMVLAIMFTTPSSAGRIVDGIVAAVDAGTLSPARLDEAATRVATLRLTLAAQGRGLMPCEDCAPAE